MVILNGRVRFRDGCCKVSRLIEPLGLLAPRVRRAFEIRRRLEGQWIETAGMEAALDRVRTSVFPRDGRGVVVFANRAAQRALKAGEGLWQDRSGRLWLTDRNAAVAHGRALTGPAAGQGESSALRLAGDRQVAATLDPLLMAGEPGALLAPPAPPRALLVLSDAPPEAPHAGAALARLYGLTPAAQALSLAIAAGKTLAEIDEERGVGPQTLRNHLKSIFARTGLSRQAQLAAAVARQSLLSQSL